jgi:hypothetical protein
MLGMVKKGNAAKLMKLLIMTFAYPSTCYQHYDKCLGDVYRTEERRWHQPNW